MATTTIVPVEEYLRTSYDPDMEYVDGALLERHVGERKHSRLQFLIGAELGPREQERFHTYTGQRLRVSPQPRYRVPDLCLMALPYQRDSVFTHPPHLIIEILSPDDEPAAWISASCLRSWTTRASEIVIGRAGVKVEDGKKTRKRRAVCSVLWSIAGCSS